MLRRNTCKKQEELVASKYDNSDRKSLNNLIEKITNKKTKNIAQSAISRYFPKAIEATESKTPRKNKEQTSCCNSKSNKKTTQTRDWLSKETCIKEKEEKKIGSKKSNSKKRKLEPDKLDITVNKPKKISTKLMRNESFEKYGIVLPSFEKIVAEQKSFDKYKKCIESLDSSFDIDNIIDTPLELYKEKRFSREILDCKHLTLDQLHESFTKHFNTLSDIFNGKLYSERHERYHHFDPKFIHTTKDLTYNTSMIVFTHEQNDYLVNLMSEKLDPNDKFTNYFFKVLLPELCLLIFMDTHDMNRTEAVNYLDERPID